MFGIDTTTILILSGLGFGVVFIVALLSSFFAYRFLKPHLQTRGHINPAVPTIRRAGLNFCRRDLPNRTKRIFTGIVIAAGVSLLTVLYLRPDTPQQLISADSLHAFGDAGSAESADALPRQFSANDPRIYRLPEVIHPNGLNFIFVADRYEGETWNDFEKDVAVLMDGLTRYKPFDQYDRFNVFKIMPESGDEFCSIKVENERKPVLRCDERINEYLNALTMERFKVIVLSRQEFQSWANVKRLENSAVFFSVPQPIPESGWNYAPLFAHMIGHAFGLKDEEEIVLAKADSAVMVPDGPNCAPDRDTAARWWGDLTGRDGVGYFNGCSGNLSYIKPTKHSVMNLNHIPSSVEMSTYGLVSEQYLKKVLDYCFSGLTVSATDDPEFFALYPEFLQCLHR